MSDDNLADSVNGRHVPERLNRDDRVQIVVDINALRALAPLPRAPVPRPSRPQPRTPQPRWSRRHSAHEPPGAPTAPARL